jgi:hypothetical protein
MGYGGIRKMRIREFEAALPTQDSVRGFFVLVVLAVLYVLALAFLPRKRVTEKPLRKSLLDLEGKVQFAPGYDYKALR